MKGRITREHDVRQDYEGVYFEGGSAVTDADLNAGFDVQRSMIETLQKAWITPAGTPDNGWKVTDLSTFNSGGKVLVDFKLQPGHYGLDGNLLKNPASYLYSDQPYALSADLDAGFQLTKPTLAEVSAAPDQALYDAIVLDTQRVSVRVTEDSELDEVAMRSDPATRSKFSPKVRCFRGLPSDCAEARREVLKRIAAPNADVSAPSPKINSLGRLRVRLGAVANVDNPCAPELATGYFGRLNHTIKVKQMAPDRFVWGYRNGEGLYRASVQDPTTLSVITPFEDSAVYPVSGQIVELCSWDMSLPNGEKTAVSMGRFHAIAEGYSPQTGTLVLDKAIEADLLDWYNTRLAVGENPFLFLRFWEPPQIPMDTSDPTGANLPLADTGVFLDFLHNGMPGDQWTFSVRTHANDTVFPKRMMEPGGQPPLATERYVDLLALIHWTIKGTAVVGHIHDCRQRVRPLWKQEDCCTFKVGDGVTSFGDFDRLQDAIDALPHSGGQIFLLPGRHWGGVVLRDRRNVTITGCDNRSRILQNNTANVPLIVIEDCVDIRLKDMLFLDATSLAIAGARNKRLALHGIATQGRGSAISLIRHTGLQIKDCSFFALAEPSIMPATQFRTLRPLAFVGGSAIEIRDSSFRCEPSDDLTLQSLGGLQVASKSDDVWIENNVISGGLGNGLTLGHVNKLKVYGTAFANLGLLKQVGKNVREAFEEHATWHHNGRMAQIIGAEMMTNQTTDASMMALIQSLMEGGTTLVLDENPIEISAVAEQGCLGIDPTVPQPDPAETDTEWDEYFVEGDISHIHIIDNEISRMGGSGISSVAWNISTRRAFGALQVSDIAVDRNHIQDCCLVAIATTLADTEIQEIGFGGIALEQATNAVFSGNIIEKIGLNVRTPSTGIYLREATNAHIHGNVIRDIGRIERLENTNITGISGGIIVDQCWPVYADDSFAVPAHIRGKMVSTDYLGVSSHEYEAYIAKLPADLFNDFKRPRGEAIRVHNNVVSVNFGMALDLRGSGSMKISNNSLTSLAARSNPGRWRLSLAISVVNTELELIERLTERFGDVELYTMSDSGQASNYKPSSFLPRFAPVTAILAAYKFFDVIQYENNQSYFENLKPQNDGLSICAVISPFDIQVSNNTLKSLHLDTSLSMHLFAAGYYSTQCFANRFDTRPNGGVHLAQPHHEFSSEVFYSRLGGVRLAAMTIGIDNSTCLNHASQPIHVVALNPISFAGSANLAP